MATKEELIAQAQALLDALNALEVTPAPTITEVKVEESDGTEEKFSPEA